MYEQLVHATIRIALITSMATISSSGTVGGGAGVVGILANACASGTRTESGKSQSCVMRMPFTGSCSTSIQIWTWVASAVIKSA